MFLIMSAAYVDQELKSEFGCLPPSLLPLGNCRLFKHQLAAIDDTIATRVYLTLPESYCLSSSDSQWLMKKKLL